MNKTAVNIHNTAQINKTKHVTIAPLPGLIIVTLESPSTTYM
jgi:hypothetical protein